jgi:hypothetical protein
MACEITIGDIRLVGLGPVAIEVSGSAVGCASVLVSLSCLDATDGPFIEATAAVTGGSWTAVFPDATDARCSCDGTTRIDAFAVARCVTDPACIATPNPFKKTIKCDLCPAVVLIEPELNPSVQCNPDGTVSVTLQAQINNATGSTVIVHIGCGPGGSPIPFPPGTVVHIVSQGTTVVSQVCQYSTPVTPEPLVIIDSPTGCPPVPIEIEHQICCPDPASITVSIGECVGGMRQVTFDLGGSFSGSIDYGDGSPSQVFAGSLLSHDYAVPPTSYTATLEVAFCEDIPVAVDGLDPCEEVGACCLPDGSCETATVSDCAGKGGEFQGDGVACADTDCSPTGACCLPDGSCAQHSAADCEALSGRYQGDESLCADIDQVGACCLPGGSCVDLTQCACLARGGDFLGIGSNCVGDNPVGACCLPDDSCEALTRCACDDRDGSFKGAGTSCAQVDCITDGDSCFSSIGAFICCLLRGLLWVLIVAFIGQVVAAFCPFPPNTTLIATAAGTLLAILLLLGLLLLCSWSFCRILRALIWIFEWTAIACLVAFFFCLNAALLLVAFGFGVLAGLLLLVKPSCGWPKLLRWP